MDTHERADFIPSVTILFGPVGKLGLQTSIHIPSDHLEDQDAQIHCVSVRFITDAQNRTNGTVKIDPLQFPF